MYNIHTLYSVQLYIKIAILKKMNFRITYNKSERKWFKLRHVKITSKQG